MARYRLLLAALAIYVLRQANCQEAQITISTRTLELKPTEEDSTETTSVKCQPPQGYNKRIFTMKIWREIGSRKTLMVTTDPVDPNAQANAARLGSEVAGQEKFAASGSILTDRSITLTIQKTSCKDAAQYQCSISMADNSDAIVNPMKTANLTVNVGAGDITMIKSPLLEKWIVNDTVTFACNGIIGSVDNGVEITWEWEYQDENFGYAGEWKPYRDETYGLPEDVTTEPYVTSSVCYKHQTSKLKRHLQLVDNNRNYRCYVYRGSKSYVKYAKQSPVGKVTETGQTSTTTETSATQPEMTCFTECGQCSTNCTLGNQTDTTSGTLVLPQNPLCEFQNGACKHIDVGCEADYYNGGNYPSRLCDDENFICCVPTDEIGDRTCKARGGKCLDKRDKTCKGGHWRVDLCPGGAYMQCCLRGNRIP